MRLIGARGGEFLRVPGLCAGVDFDPPNAITEDERVPGSNLANLAAARAARDSGKLGSELLNGLGSAVIATDTDGYIVFWNRAAEELYGWRPEEAYGRNIFDVLASPEFREAGPVMVQRLGRGESWAGEFITRHKDGRAVRALISHHPVRDQLGQLTAVLSISREIPARLRRPIALAARPASRVMGVLSRADDLLRQALGPLDSIALRDVGLVVLLYGLACAARIPLDLISPRPMPFVTFFPAIVAAAYLTGAWPTALLILASAVTGGLWSYASFGQGTTSAVIFAVTAAIVAAPTIYAARAHRSLQRKDAELRLINRELKHRLKNLFAVTSSVCQQTINSKIPREGMAAAVAGRIRAIAQAQDLLGVNPTEGSDLRSLADAVLQPLCPDPSRLDVGGPEVSLPGEATTPFALILHELATNALKHGAWAGERGKVLARWDVSGERRLRFEWQEQNARAVTPSEQEGFGSVVIKRALNQAKVEHVIAPEGARCSIELPI